MNTPYPPPPPPPPPPYVNSHSDSGDHSQHSDMWASDRTEKKGFRFLHAVLIVVGMSIFFGIIGEFVMNGGSSEDDVSVTSEAAVEEVEESESSTTQDASGSVERDDSPEPESDPEPDPEPAEERSTGSYASDQHYIGEVVDTVESMAGLLELIAELADGTSMGVYTPGQFGELMLTAEQSVQSHIDFYESRQAPDGMQRFEDKFLDALYTIIDAIVYSQDCGFNMNVSSCERSAQLIDSVVPMLEDAMDHFY